MRRSGMQRSALPTRLLFTRLLFSAALGAASLMVVIAQQAPQQSPGIFNTAQVQSGEAIYTQNCAGCHGVNFEESGDAPPLAGGTFLLKWRPKMVSELFVEILQTMPPTNPGSLGEPAALNATAYILERNGGQPGQQALTGSASMLIRTIANGQAPATNTQAQGRGGRGSMVVGAGSGNGRGGVSATHGVNVAGEVKNYVPVTKEMLRNPPAEDWLI